MTPAADSSFLGFWSPTSIVAGVDRLADRAATIRQASSSGPAEAAFEQALADELVKDRSAHPVDGRLALLYRTHVGEVLDTRPVSATVDSRKTAASGLLVDSSAAGADRRVGFETDAGQTQKAGSDHAVNGFQTGDQGAFWLGDRFTDMSASSIAFSGVQDSPPVDAGAVQKVYFNGDGRPIVLSSIEHLQLPAGAAEDALSEGNLLILPNGAVVDCGPWTANVSA